MLVPDGTALELPQLELGRRPGRLVGSSRHDLISQAVCGRIRLLILLLIGIWVLNLFDLQFTLMALQLGLLREMNPVAAGVMAHGDSALVAYKAALVIVPTGLLWWCRRHPWAVRAAWLVATIYVVLAVSWYLLYQEATSALIRFKLAQGILPL
jgi:hypothetical protein